MKSAIALLAGLALAGCAADGTAKADGEDGAELSARLAGATFGRTPGQPVGCVEVAELTGNRALGRPLLLFEARGRRLYANRVQSCPSLRYGYQIRLKTVSARLCRGDPVEVLDARGAVVPGTCTVGDFLAYEPRR